MKVRHVDQCIGGIPLYRFSPDGSIFELYDRFNYLCGYLWSGRRTKVMESFDRLLWLLDRVRDEVPDSERSARMAIAHLCDLEAYLQKNASGIVSYREWRKCRQTNLDQRRRRHGQPVDRSSHVQVPTHVLE